MENGNANEMRKPSSEELLHAIIESSTAFAIFAMATDGKVIS